MSVQVTQNVGASLLYQQDVEEFRQSILNRCRTSFFDNMDLICKFVADENGNPIHLDETEMSDNCLR